MTSPTDTAAPSVLDRYADLADRFGTVVDSLPPAAWDAPSACEGWSGRDVLEHVIGSQRGFLRTRGLELGADPDVTDDPVSAWRAHDEEMVRLLADESVCAQEYDGMFGRTTIDATVANFYGFDLIVHRWDLARAAGRDERFSDAELEAIEAALPAFGEHLYDDGVCKPALPVAADADRQASVLARLGRAHRR
ncbi:TIGR03086 family metal-binding protein [Intrasporangium sp. DVR]|uniref:TIGR03086 family metal-binding protein n=1 Tax=Intrasporangium sp. DVR TaxID=3127867 RepID=UPI00313A53CA